MQRLLVVGAINTDLIAFVERAPDAGETVAGGHFEQHGGGKGANQAVAAARSDAEVSLLSAIGDDAFGLDRRGELMAAGIDTSSVASIQGVASGIAMITVESSGENRISDLPGARAHLTADDCISAYKRIHPKAILATNELPYECLLSLFREAHDDRVPIWFNAAPLSGAARELIPFVDTLIVNRGEAAGLLEYSDDTDISTLLAGLRALGIPRSVITLGGDGLVAYDANREVHLPAEPVVVVDTTGAGDTFCGAWAAELMQGRSFEDVLRYANRAAAVSVGRRGAQSSIPNRSEI